MDGWQGDRNKSLVTMHIPWQRGPFVSGKHVMGVCSGERNRRGELRKNQSVSKGGGAEERTHMEREEGCAQGGEGA